MEDFKSILNRKFFLVNSADQLDPKELMPWIPGNNVRSSSCVSNDTTTSALSNMRLPRDTAIEIPPHPDHNQQQRHSCWIVYRFTYIWSVDHNILSPIYKVVCDIILKPLQRTVNGIPRTSEIFPPYIFDNIFQI